MHVTGSEEDDVFLVKDDRIQLKVNTEDCQPEPFFSVV